MLKITDLKFRFGPEGPWLLDGINLELPRGRCLAVRGHNGSGKSTLVSILAGIIPEFKSGILEGSVVIGGDRGERPSCVLQNIDSQILSGGVRDELRFFLDFSSGEGMRKAGAEEAASALGIGELLGRNVRELSGGEKQRLVLAVSLAFGGKRLLLLDEPLAYLDAEAAALLAGKIHALKREGTAVFLAGHVFTGLENVIDGYLLLENGKLTPPAVSPFPGGAEAGNKNPPASAGEPVINGGSGGKEEEAVLLKASGVSCSAGEAARLLDGIKLEIKAGEIAGIQGKNGAGKSLLAKILAGQERPASGEFLLSGKPATGRERARNISYLGQNPYNFFFHRTVAENLRENRRAGSGSPCAGADEGIAALGLGNLLGRDIAGLSFGEAQKAALLCALLSCPKVLIFDEPLLSLDDSSLRGIKALLDKFTGSGKSVIIISHLRETLRALCARIYHLEEGKLTLV